MDCGKKFKIQEKSLNTEIICPYCGIKNEIDSTHTKEQVEYAVAAAKEEIMQEVHSQFGNMLKKLKTSSRGPIQIKVKSTPYRKRMISPPEDFEMDSEIECSQCEGFFQVDGIFGFCPLCKNGNTQIYDANIEIILNDIEKSPSKQRALRHAYGDIVSAFETICIRYSTVDDGTNFQNMKNAKQHFKKHQSIDIYSGVDEREKLILKRVFLKRHAYIHSKGIITERYVKEIPQDRKLLGTKAKLSEKEFIAGSRILKKIVSNVAIL